MDKSRPDLRKAGLATSLSALATHSPRAWLAVGTTVFIVSVAMTASLKMDTNFVNIFKADSEFRTSFEYFDREFQGGQAIELVVDSGEENGALEPSNLRQVDELENWIDGIAEMGKPNSIINFIKQMNRSLNNDQREFWSIPGRSCQQHVSKGNPSPHHKDQYSY